MKKSLSPAMALHIRPFEPHRDYPAAAALHSADPLDVGRSAAELELLEARIPRSCHMKSWMIEEAGSPIGFASTFRAAWDLRRGGILLRLHMAPSSSLASLRQSYSFLIRQAKRSRAAWVMIWSRDDNLRRTAFLDQHGFHLVKRHAVTRLKVQSFIPEPYLPRFTVLEKKGIEFVNGIELLRRGLKPSDLLQKAMNRIMKEEFGFDGDSRPPYEKFARRAASPLAEDPDTSTFALHNHQVIGFTRLHPSEAEPGLLRTGLTGVVPSWRNLKVGTCLKVASIQRAAQLGARFIQTDNAEDNPMLHLNLKLGFARVATLLEYEMVMPRSLPADLSED